MAEVSPAGARAADNSNKKRKHPPNSNSVLNDEMQSEKQQKKEAPILFLNVGGVNKNVRRSLFNELNDRGGDNPLCDLVLKGTEHWSDVPTIDDDGTIRLYLDRNPEAFDDLLEYIEYGKLFLEKIVGGGGRGRGDNSSNCSSNSRLMRLQMECDFWTVDSLSKDIQDVMFGEAVTFRSDDWFSVAGKCCRDNPDDEEFITGWKWENVPGGNESIAGTPTTGNKLAMAQVKRTGTYLVFFSLHSMAVRALSSGAGYEREEEDEFCQLNVFHGEMTNTGYHWTYPLIRCGAFDYREEIEERRNNPYLFTAAVAEPIALKEGMLLYSTHGTGYSNQFGVSVGQSVINHTPFSEEHPHGANFITLVQVFGEGIAKWVVKREKDWYAESEPSTVKWMPAPNDFWGGSIGAYLDGDDDTKIRFEAAGHYLLLGRVASRLKKHTKNILDLHNNVQLELRTNGGLPLQVNPGIVKYKEFDWNEDGDFLYNDKMAEYGNINDIIYAEADSYISVKATGGACFALHGMAPELFDRIPTQSLTAIRLGDMQIDRYKVVSYDDGISYKRSLGGEESVPRQEPLFAISEEGTGDLIALEDCRCIIVGSLPSTVGPTCSLLKNGVQIVNSQLCKGAHGSHTLNAVVELKAKDGLCVVTYETCWDDRGAHLAFIVLG